MDQEKLKIGDFVEFDIKTGPPENQKVQKAYAHITDISEDGLFAEFAIFYAPKIYFTALQKMNEREGNTWFNRAETKYLKKTTPKFQLFESGGCFYVVFPGQEEKEISKVEYEQLQDQKARMLENVVNEPVIFETREMEYDVIARTTKHNLEIKREKVPDKDGIYKFICGTITGKMYETDATVVLSCLLNSQKQNGHFADMLHVFKCDFRRPLVIESIYNPRLYASLILRGFRPITKTSCLWMRSDQDFLPF